MCAGRIERFFPRSRGNDRTGVFGRTGIRDPKAWRRGRVGRPRLHCRFVPRSALPCRMATDKPLAKGDWVTVDYGAGRGVRLRYHAEFRDRRTSFQSQGDRRASSCGRTRRPQGDLGAGVSVARLTLSKVKVIQDAGMESASFIPRARHRTRGSRVRRDSSPISADILQKAMCDGGTRDLHRGLRCASKTITSSPLPGPSFLRRILTGVCP